jgi:antitoxin component of MazEF toxin-antitoxin module
MVHEFKVRRKIYEQGGSLLVTLPKIWADDKNLRRGSTVVIAFDGILKIYPEAEAGGA